MAQVQDQETESNAKGLQAPRQRALQSVFFPAHKSGPLRAFALRGGIALFCLVFTTALVYFGRGGYYDSQSITGKPTTPLDALYFATVTLSTTGYGDIVPSSDWARFLSAVVITPLRIIFLIVLVGSTLEVLTERTRAEFREQRWRKKVHDHTVVIGYGVKGRSAVKALIDNGGDPRQIVVVSPDATAVEDASARGCVGLVGSGRRDEILLRAGIDRAARVVVATDSDDTAVLITLNSRRLAPSATIVAAAREQQHVEVLRQSGANAVITTAEAAGRLMGISLLSPVAGALMEDLLEPGRGLEVAERAVDPTEVGKLVGEFADHGEIVLAVIRDGNVNRFDVCTDLILVATDRVVIIRHK